VGGEPHHFAAAGGGDRESQKQSRGFSKYQILQSGVGLSLLYAIREASRERPFSNHCH